MEVEFPKPTKDQPHELISLTVKAKSHQPYRPLLPMKLKILESPLNEDNIQCENVAKSGYKPLPKRIIKLWKHPPKILKHDLFEDCTDQNKEEDLSSHSDIISQNRPAKKKQNDDSCNKSLDCKKRTNEKDSEMSKNSGNLKGASKNTEQFVKDSPKSTTAREHPEPSTSRASIDLTAEEPAKSDAPNSPDALKYCPLCLAPFTQGMTQMDKDNHLAVCLSSAEDDVVW